MPWYAGGWSAVVFVVAVVSSVDCAIITLVDCASVGKARMSRCGRRFSCYEASLIKCSNCLLYYFSPCLPLHPTMADNPNLSDADKVSTH